MFCHEFIRNIYQIYRSTYGSYTAFAGSTNCLRWRTFSNAYSRGFCRYNKLSVVFRYDTIYYCGCHFGKLYTTTNFCRTKKIPMQDL